MDKKSILHKELWKWPEWLGPMFRKLLAGCVLLFTVSCAVLFAINPSPLRVVQTAGGPYLWLIAIVAISVVTAVVIGIAYWKGRVLPLFMFPVCFLAAYLVLDMEEIILSDGWLTSEFWLKFRAAAAAATACTLWLGSWWLVAMKRKSRRR